MGHRRRLPDFLNTFLRIGSVLLAVLCQLALVVVTVLVLNSFAFAFYLLMQFCSFLLIYFLVNDEAQYKTNWILLVFLLPGCGFLLYFLWGSKREYSWFNRRFRQAEQEIGEGLPDQPETERRCAAAFPNEAPVGRYLARSGYPVYENRCTRFFPCGDAMYHSLIPDLKAAKRSIHIEMFILDKGVIWDELFPILREKAAAGLDVRLLLDDFGSLKASTPRFRRQVRAAGIQLAFFAPINKDVLHFSFNFRTHQKYILIDNAIGYTGGINLADEYFDRRQRFGYWKDTAVRVTGDAVASMEGMFLVMWQVCTGTAQRLPPPLPRTAAAETDSPVFVRPFAGGPARNPDNPVEVLYDMVVDRATEYLYITTPYLVLDRSMAGGLIRAAKSGVDVRIMMPGIYDKWYVRMVSNDNFGLLLRHNIRIFEYTPGFLHAKMLVADGKSAICGSVNLDFRSLWQHYEDGVYFCGGQIVEDIKADILSIQADSREVLYEDWKRRGLLTKLMQKLLGLLAPLM